MSSKSSSQPGNRSLLADDVADDDVEGEEVETLFFGARDLRRGLPRGELL